MTSWGETLRHTIAHLTAAGAHFELHELPHNGRPQRAYRHAFPTLQAMLQAARAHGAKPFIVDDAGHTLSFDALFAQADALAAHWQATLQLLPGQRVAIALRNCPEWAVAFVAAQLCGAVPAPLNSFGKRHELCDNLAELQPRVLVCDEERLARVQGAAELHGVQVYVAAADAWIAAIATNAATRVEVNVASDDPALILYTSGASSRAKGVLSTHRAVCQALFNIDFIGAISAALSPAAMQRLMARALPPTTLTVVPLFHVSGLHAQLLLALRHGRRLVFQRRWDAAAALALMREHRVTQFNAAPAMVQQLLDEPGFDEVAAASLGGLGFGGAGLSERLIADVSARMAGSMSGIGFGMTESNGVGAAGSGALFEQRPQASGVLSPIVEVRIESDDGQALATGERGEICLRGVSLMQGYWQQGEATAQALRGGWLHTGDIGFVDADGLLHVVDRIKDVINRSGEKVAAAEVESCLLLHPGVQEVAVLAVPDAKLGEAVVAVVVPRAGVALDAATMQAHVAARLAAYKVPSGWYFSAERLPRNPAGKVLKTTLREQWLAAPRA